MGDGCRRRAGRRLRSLAGCATKPNLPPGVHPTVEVGPPLKSVAWKAVATAADQDRSPGSALPGRKRSPRRRRPIPATSAGKAKLLLPRSALPRPAPTPGSYNCRLIALGKATAKGKAFESFKPFFCYVEVEGDQMTIVKQTGSQRPAGRLWEDDDANRLIFLGSLALGDEEAPLAYGDDPKRNMAGVLERIGAFRWRLVIPWPQSDTKLAGLRADAGGLHQTAAVSEAGLLADPAEVRAILVASAQAGEAISYAEVLELLGHHFTRPKMRQLCKVLAFVDDEAEERGEPELAVLVVRQSDGLPGQGWWVGGAKKHGYTGLWEGPKAAKLIRKIQGEAFEYWANRP